MSIKIIDGGQVHNKFEELLKNFMPFAQKKLGYDKPVDVQLVSDPENAKDPLGKTAYYDPNLMRITIFVDKRHAKDILRSLSHELVHHKQNCDGHLSDIAVGDGYAQRDPHLRAMETEAEDKTNTLLFRDWEDQYKMEQKQGDQLMNESILKEAIRHAIGFVQQEALGVRGAEGQVPEGPAPEETGGDLKSALMKELATLDNVPTEAIESIAEKVLEILSQQGTGVMSESPLTALAKAAKKLADKKKKEEEEEKKEPGAVAQAVAAAQKKVASGKTNENWARAGKDKQLLGELIKRWCK